MTNNFSIKVSERLRGLGVEGETEIYWKQYRQYTDPWELGEKDEGLLKDFCLPAYRLDDILRLMLRIGEKMGWETTPLGTQYFYIERNDCEYPVETLVARFREGDYPKAEQYLLTILKQ